MGKAHEVLDRRVYAAGEMIFKEGEVGRRCAYLVQSGKVEISKKTAEGQARVLGYITDGGIFGEMALVDNKPRMAMARAVDSTTVIIVTEATFEDKLRKTDPFIRGLLNIFVRNIRETTDKMLNQAGEPPVGE
ncbi:MAG TPA: cyclic nucleotide-binding domain-containing protein [Candidatus Sulfotelmatobacter sp.]|jgi:CRP-like cAMP-binding protein|nr:cyclic nucleotide-binding domain-containing protein [Candidatus Sulfotelmatobacter sp.]